MCGGGSCLSCIGYILLNLSILACLAAFCSPFWLEYNLTFKGAFSDPLNSLKSFSTKWEGLWGECDKDMQCRWVWQDDFALEKTLPDWKKASQGLYAGGVVLILVSVLISSLHLCCCCCKGSFSIRSAMGSLVLAGVLCIAASLAVYGGFLYKEDKLSEALTFAWGYYLGIAGVCACFVASLLFFLDGCFNRNHEGYHMTRVV
ncbi:hypothetical protein HELRODRAFT_195043 [Helobdella robusta]|uniref:Claudin n=1 Tax=Helobdella robusta TaxID=6412 RepID=T1FWP5_HELRO|nr:hypothetical protein HELRODRAFT_195043 [Helobdella robusta]ESO09653.1 hypothetical protein HELRODRAFT_195043 [Helobdella robusta]